MATAHPFGAFVGCRFKRIGCVHRIKVNVAFTFFHLRNRVLGCVCMGVYTCMLDFKLA